MAQDVPSVRFSLYQKPKQSFIEEFSAWHQAALSCLTWGRLKQTVEPRYITAYVLANISQQVRKTDRCVI